MSRRGAGLTEFRILGPLEVVTDDGRVELGPAKPRALLGLLLLARGRSLTRDELVERLWSGAAPASAVTTLQGYVANLRRRLEPGRDARTASVLVSRHGGYAVEADVLDADRFEVELADGRRAREAGDLDGATTALTRALARWRGEVLPELPDDPAATAERGRLEELRVAAVEDLADVRLRAGGSSAAAADLRHLLADHPLRERARGLLALACYRDGRQAEALQVLAEGRWLLDEELGLDPGPALQRLEQAILRQDDALGALDLMVPAGPAAGGHEDRSSGRPQVTARDVPPGQVPLVGRTEELRALRHALREGGVALVSGEPGVGKTRLLEELTVAAREDHTVLQGRCPDGEGVPPHWPWRQVLTGLSGDSTVAAEADGPFAVGLAVAERLRAAAGERPLLILLEDIHWADEASLRVLQVVSEELVGAAALLVATYRSEAAAQAPLADTLATMARLRALLRVPLRGLTADEVATYVRAMTGEEPDPDRCQLLYARTAGNPFFLAELARLGTDGELPTGVRDVVRLRVSRLPEPAAVLLRVGSLIGRDVPVRIAGSVGDVTGTALLDAVDAVVNSGLASEPVAGRLRFTHALVREALSGELTAVRRAALHGVIADELERTGASAAVLAHHRTAAVVDGHDERAAAACLVAAQQALDELAAERAAELATRGGELAPPAAAELRGDLAAVEGAAKARLGDLDGATAALTRAVELARAAVDWRRLARAALVRAGGTVHGFWTAPAYVDLQLLTLLEEAVDGLGTDDPALAARVLADLVAHLRLVGRVAEAEDAAARATQLAAEVADPAATIASLRARIAVTAPDALDERLALIGQLLAAADGQTDVVVGARVLEAMTRYAAADVAGSDRAAAEAERIAREHRLPDLVLLCESWRASRLLADGDWEEAERIGEELFGRADELGPIAGRTAADAATTIQGIVGWHRGRMPELLDAFTERREASSRQWRWVIALALAEAGRLEDCRAVIADIADPALTGLEPGPMGDHGAVLMAEAVTLIGGDERAAALLERLQPYAGQLFVARVGDTCLGAVDHYLGGLRWVLGDLDGAVTSLERAIALDDRSGARPYAVRARERLVRVLLARDIGDDRQRAARLWEQAAAEAEALGMTLLRRWLAEVEPEANDVTVDRAERAAATTGPRRPRP